MAHRTEHDRQMIEHFDPSKGGADSYHSPPWPVYRTPQDVKLQDRWCDSCNNHPHNKDQYEGYAPVFGFRTKADIALQDKWCPKCKCQPSAQCICPNGPKDDPYHDYHNHPHHGPVSHRHPHHHSGPNPSPYHHHPNPYPHHHPNPTGGGE